MAENKTPEELIRDMTAVTEAATEIKLRQLNLEKRRAVIEKQRVEELQRLARQDAKRLQFYKKLYKRLEVLSRDITEIKQLISGCSVREKGNKKLDRLFYMLFWELTAKKELLPKEARELLELYSRESNLVSVHTGTEIKSEGNMKTSDITGGDVSKIGRSEW